MERTLVIITGPGEKDFPADYPEIIKQEQEVIAKWKEAGILEHLFLKRDKSGVVLVFKESNEEKVEALVKTLPIYKLQKGVEYLGVLEYF
jgi:hypothetical protein